MILICGFKWMHILCCFGYWKLLIKIQLSNSPSVNDNCVRKETASFPSCLIRWLFRPGCWSFILLFILIPWRLVFCVVAAISWSQTCSTSSVIVSEVRTEATCKEKVSYHPLTGQWGGGSYFLPSLLLSLCTHTLSCHFPHQVNAPTERSNKSQSKRPIIQHNTVANVMRERSLYTLAAGTVRRDSWGRLYTPAAGTVQRISGGGFSA